MKYDCWMHLGIQSLQIQISQRFGTYLGIYSMLSKKNDYALKYNNIGNASTSMRSWFKLIHSIIFSIVVIRFHSYMIPSILFSRFIWSYKAVYISSSEISSSWTTTELTVDLRRCELNNFHLRSIHSTLMT